MPTFTLKPKPKAPTFVAPKPKAEIPKISNNTAGEVAVLTTGPRAETMSSDAYTGRAPAYKAGTERQAYVAHSLQDGMRRVDKMAAAAGVDWAIMSSAYTDKGFRRIFMVGTLIEVVVEDNNPHVARYDTKDGFRDTGNESFEAFADRLKAEFGLEEP